MRDDLILDAEDEIVVLPLRGDRRVACGFERVLGTQFDLFGGAHDVMSGRDGGQTAGGFAGL